MSSLQKEVIGSSSAGLINSVINAGLNPLPICQCDKAGTMSDSAWKSYCNTFSSKLNNKVIAVQIGNEWNTARFFGAAPNSERSGWLFKTAADIIRKKFPKIKLLAPGLTNENKSDGETKMAAKTFITNWIKLKIDKYFDFWALHYYHTDKKYENVFLGNIDYINKNSKAKIVITETGSTENAISWYAYIRNNLFKKVPGKSWAWYCLTNHEGFEILNSKTLAPYPIYNEIKKYNA
jgi:hypothetical protein